MTTISRTDLRQLADTENEHLVSLYLPMYVGVESSQNPVRIKNLLAVAEESLCGRGLRRPDAERRLAAARQVLDQPEIWKAPEAHGLAAFITSDEARVWHLPFKCEELCVVGSSFHVLPLLEWFAENTSYYVLAVSQNSVRLFHGTRYQLDQLDLAGLPRNLGEALGYDQREGAYQTHSASPHLPGKESLVFHGQGGSVDVSKDELTSFFREIDRVLANELRHQNDPLVFAGVDYLFPIYQEVNSYAHLSPTPMPGNPELLTIDEIRKLAWPIVESTVDQCWQDELTKYGNYIPLNRTADRIEDIILAAHAGAVDTVFIDPAARATGAFDAHQLRVHIDEHPQEDSEDLINLAASLVLRNSGTVKPLDSKTMPSGGVMAAILRYPFPPASQIEPAGAKSGAVRG